MADVFDEVEEELRKERYQELFRKYGPWVLGAAIAIIAGVAGYQWYSAQTENARSEAGARMLAAVEAFQDGAYGQAENELETLQQSAPRGYETLALMQRAAIALETGNSEDAARLYGEAARAAPDRLTRDVARYKALLIDLETLSYDDIVLRAEPLTEGEAPLGPLARELMGMAAIEAERWEEARRHYNLLTVSLDATQNLQRRAAEAMALINQRAPREPQSMPANPAPEGASAPDQEDN